MTYEKPSRWKNAANKIFAHQVGFTAPPHDFDAAPTDFLSIAPPGVGAHGRMLHLDGYAHQLQQRTDNFHLLEEFVTCMANNGADVCGQVGTNWVHAGGKKPADIEAFETRMAETYATPLFMAGMSLVHGLRALGAEKIVLNSVYYWPDWRDGIARFLREAGFDLLYVGNLVDLGLYPDQDTVNAKTWIFPHGDAALSMQRALDKAPTADAIVVNGMPNFRRTDGITERMLHVSPALEAALGVPIVASDTALYWRIMRHLGVHPTRPSGRLLETL